MMDTDNFSEVTISCPSTKMYSLIAFELLFVLFLLFSTIDLLKKVWVNPFAMSIAILLFYIPILCLFVSDLFLNLLAKIDIRVNQDWVLVNRRFLILSKTTCIEKQFFAKIQTIEADNDMDSFPQWNVEFYNRSKNQWEVLVSSLPATQAHQIGQQLSDVLNLPYNSQAVLDSDCLIVKSGSRWTQRSLDRAKFAVHSNNTVLAIVIGYWYWTGKYPMLIFLLGLFTLVLWVFIARNTSQRSWKTCVNLAVESMHVIWTIIFYGFMALCVFAVIGGAHNSQKIFSMPMVSVHRSPELK